MTDLGTAVADRMGVANRLAALAAALAAEDLAQAEDLARTLPPAPTTPLSFPLTTMLRSPASERARVKVRSLTPRKKLPVYQRDGFIDRYSPERWRLVHPGALRVLSLRLPKWLHTSLGPHNIPAKYATNSPVWFDVWPAVDHVIPRAHAAGSNAESNLTCVSWWRNNSKRDRLLEETGWQLQPGGELSEWDGLQAWFLGQVDRDRSLLDDPMVRNWHILPQSAGVRRSVASGE